MQGTHLDCGQQVRLVSLSQAGLVARSLKPFMLFRERLHFPAKIPSEKKNWKHQGLQGLSIPVGSVRQWQSVEKLLQRQHNG